MPKKTTKKGVGGNGHAPALRIRRSEIHGRGLFAEERIGRGTWIGTYEGPQVQRDGKYVLWIYEGDEPCYGIAGKNHMRFINHSERPNAEFREEECFAIRTIKPGEEITFDYGEEWYED